MSSQRSVAASQAYTSLKEDAAGLYGSAISGSKQRMGFINQQLGAGEPAYLRDAFAGQRGALTEGISRQGGVARAQQMEGAGAALSGGNQFANMNPVDIGSQLANALYGSRFAEGQANIDQSMNLLGMALGGAGQAGSGALGAAQNQLGAIQFQPGYNQTYANIAGGLAGGASLYGMLNKYGLFDPAKTTSSGGFSGSGSGVVGW